jgi:hypothetical protein
LEDKRKDILEMKELTFKDEYGLDDNMTISMVVDYLLAKKEGKILEFKDERLLKSLIKKNILEKIIFEPIDQMLTNTREDVIFVKVSKSSSVSGYSRGSLASTYLNKEIDEYTWEENTDMLVAFVNKSFQFPEQNDYLELYDTILNLSWEKLERIHRFIRLWRKAKLDFRQLDYILAGANKNSAFLHEGKGLDDSIMKYCPYFDGTDDVITMNLSPRSFDDLFTIEFWVKPMTSGQTMNMVTIKSWLEGDRNGTSVVKRTKMLKLGLDEKSKLFLHLFGDAVKEYTVCGDYPLPLNTFSHMSLTFHNSDGISASINGREVKMVAHDEDELESVDTILDDGREVKMSHSEGELRIVDKILDEEVILILGKGFKGCFQELRVVNKARSSVDIAPDIDTALGCET